MNLTKLLNTYCLIFIICFFVFFSFCKKEDKYMDVEKFTQNQSISDEEALYGIAKILFADSLKSFKSERNAEGKQDITIEYGGNRAYTFHSEENYSEKIQFDIVRYILIYSKPAQKRNLSSLRISLVKPYYVKEPDVKKEITEEFEVFRASISLSDLIKVPDWDNSKLLQDKRNVNNPKIVELFNQVRLKWKIEMNELNRIELK